MIPEADAHPAPVIIVGAAMGGLRTAEALRKAGYSGPLTVIGEELHAPYNRPPLSKDVLSTEVSHEAVAFPQRPATADVDWLLGVRAASANLVEKTITTTDGVRHPFTALVIATGIRPRRVVPSVSEGPRTLPGRHTVRTLDDAMALRDELVPGARVIVAGSGFIGCEVAATARKLGCEVTIVSPSALPIIRPLGAALAAELQRRHEAHGVLFRLGRSIAVIEGDTTLTGIVLDDGSRLAADVLVEAIGSDCNSEWLANTGLDLTNGVLADSGMRAIDLKGNAHDDVYVVGDIARFPNALFDDVPRRVEHWNIPIDTGKRAGAVLGAWLSRSVTDAVAVESPFAQALAQPFTPMPSFWSNQFEVSMQAYGLPGLADSIRQLEGDLAGDCIFGYYRGPRLVGVVGLGMKAALLPYRQQIASPQGANALAGFPASSRQQA
jgi:3-phenylpropionate/trans-cinnamate dioxygenase ferredoxin reductase subunit